MPHLRAWIIRFRFLLISFITIAEVGFFENNVILYIMLLELQVYFYPDDDENDELMGKRTRPVLKKDILVVNTDHIVAFNQHENGHTVIRLANSEVFEADVKFEAFRAVMEEAELARDMFVSGEN